MPVNVAYSRSLKTESDVKKLANIKSFSALDRNGLAYNIHERRVLIKEFSTGEKLFIQYIFNSFTSIVNFFGS